MITFCHHWRRHHHGGDGGGGESIIDVSVMKEAILFDFNKCLWWIEYSYALCLIRNANGSIQAIIITTTWAAIFFYTFQLLCVFDLHNANILHTEISTEVCTCCCSRCTLQWIFQQPMMTEVCCIRALHWEKFSLANWLLEIFFGRYSHFLVAIWLLEYFFWSPVPYFGSQK